MQIRDSFMLHEWLSGKILEPLFWRVKGLDIFARYNEFKHVQFDTRSEHQKRCLINLKAVAIYAIENIAFYQAFNISKQAIDSAISSKELLSLFPVLTKDAVKNHLAALHKDYDGTSFTNSTGGSTGRPVTFYQDRRYLTDSLATTLMMYEWAGRTPGEKSVKLWGAERDLIDGKLGWRHLLADWIANRMTLNSFAMDDAKAQLYLDKIKHFQPVLIEGYADSLYDLARFAKRTGSQVFQPRSIVSSAGTLHPEMRELVEQIFSCKVFDRYGSREAGNMAAECDRHNGLHVFSETTLLEVMGDDGQLCEEGEEGAILVTNLVNLTMPIIRYDIGDRAVKGAAHCGCGRPYPLLKKITGRSSSSFMLQGGGVVSPGFFIHTIGVLCNDGSIDRYQCVQKDYFHIQIKLVFFPNHSLNQWTKKNEVIGLIKKVFGQDLKLEFLEEDDIPLTATGKHLYTICEISDG